MGPSLIAPSSITPVHQLDFADLWLYIPPWPVCGNAPTQGMPHTLTVSTEVSSVKVGSTFTPGDGSNPLNLPFGGAAPTFNYFSGNASNIVALTTNIHATAADVLPMVNNELNRMQMTVPWTTNMLPSYATSNNVQNDLRVLVGKFAARSVVTVSVSDVGRCSNVGQDFTIVGTWGVHLTPANDPTVNHPEVFSFGTASEWDVQQNMYNWYFKANGTDLCEALPGIHALPLLFSTFARCAVAHSLSAELQCSRCESIRRLPLAVHSTATGMRSARNCPECTHLCHHRAVINRNGSDVGWKPEANVQLPDGDCGGGATVCEFGCAPLGFIVVV
jgi:hypothetical protein